jgi:hypothetical protein
MASGQLPFNRVAAPQFHYAEEITSNIDEDSEWLLRDRGMGGSYAGSLPEVDRLTASDK